MKKLKGFLKVLGALLVIGVLGLGFIMAVLENWH